VPKVTSHIDLNGYIAHVRNVVSNSALTLLITCRIFSASVPVRVTSATPVYRLCVTAVYKQYITRTGRQCNFCKFLKHVKTFAPSKTINRNDVKSTMKLVTLQNALIITPSRTRFKLYVEGTPDIATLTGHLPGTPDASAHCTISVNDK
jgi:hypothetical protein